VGGWLNVCRGQMSGHELSANFSCVGILLRTSYFLVSMMMSFAQQYRRRESHILKVTEQGAAPIRRSGEYSN